MKTNLKNSVMYVKQDHLFFYNAHFCWTVCKSCKELATALWPIQTRAYQASLAYYTFLASTPPNPKCDKSLELCEHDP